MVLHIMKLSPVDIQKLRKRLDWSQSELAHALGLANYMTVSHWETGFRKPTATALRLLCFLAILPDAELKKAASRLAQLGSEAS